MTAPTASAALPSLTFDTAALPIETRFAQWATYSDNYRFRQTGADPFAASASAWFLGDIMVGEHRTDPFVGVRDAERLHAAQADHISLVFLYEGQITLEIDGRRHVCRRGDLAFLDYARALTTHSGRHHGGTISLRRAFLEEAIGPIAIHGRIARSAETRLLTDFMRALVRQLPFTAAENAQPLARIVRDLIATTLRVHNIAAAESGPGRIADGRRRVIHHLETRPPGSVDLARLPEAVGMARSTLFRLFKAEGGVAAYDRQRRLGLLHRRLCDPAERRSAALLGAELGFQDPTYLSRLFRKHYGYPISSVRTRLGSPPAAEATMPATDRYRNALSRLS